MRSWRKGQLLRKMFERKAMFRKGCAAFTALPFGGLSSHPLVTMDRERRGEIITAYAKVLEQCTSPVEDEARLPYPKETIRQAIYEELRDNPDGALRNYLEIAYAQLESFLPPQEYRTLQEFKDAAALAQQTASSGNPVDIIKSARILKEAKGDKAIMIQETISEKMRYRLAQIQSTRISAMDAGY